MPSSMRYLFDSDVLIASARLHYAPAYCQLFWDWLSAGHKAGLFFSANEKSEPNSKKDIKLPDAALWLGVKTVKLFDLLQQYAGHNFAPTGMK